jgi:CMP-N-acetylneuraminic acid synthetase
MKIVALVPMRHHSERVPGKNYRPCAGRPLYHHVLRTLQRCTLIDEIVVDTDSPAILEGLHEDFPAVRAIERPEHLRDGAVPMNEVLLHDTGQVPADLYLQTHSTNPLLQVATVTRAIEALLASRPAYDSLFTVTRLQTRLWDALARPLNHNPAILLRTQDLPPVYEENSCLYLFTRQILESRRNRIGERPYLFEIDSLEAWDIDEEADFQIAELLLQTRGSPGPE